MKLTARTEPCGCWGGHGCRRIIIEFDGHVLQNACEYVLGLRRVTARCLSGNSVSDFDTFERQVARLLDDYGITPIYDAPQAWKDAVARADG
jgi:hypothetical protein